MSFRGVVVGVLLVFVLVGGALAWNAWDEVSGVLDQGEAKDEICSSLDEAVRLDLVGVATPKTMLNVEGSLDPYTCRWAVEDATTGTAYVQAVSAPADKWAESIKSELDRTPAGASNEQVDRLRKTLGKPGLTSDDACRVATSLYETAGAGRGADRMVAPRQSTTGTPLMTAESCVDGTYSSVFVTAPGLELDRSLARRTMRALQTVEKQFG